MSRINEIFASALMNGSSKLRTMLANVMARPQSIPSINLNDNPEAVLYRENVSVYLSDVLQALANYDFGEPKDVVQDPKYRFENFRVFNRFTNEQIPDDEPVFVFRARDTKSIRVLIDYATACDNPDHQGAVLKRVADFLEWQRINPGKVKEPDTDPYAIPTFIMHSPRYRPSTI